MLKLGRHMHGYSRLMIGLFALQFVAAGFCLVSPALHAAEVEMPAPMSSDVSAHCDQYAEAESSGTDQQSACAHCDAPDELISSKVSNSNVDLPVIAWALTGFDVVASLTIDLAVRPSTGPPRAPLLFHRNQRILI